MDQTVLTRTVARFREAGIVLPTFAQLADPSRIPASIRAALASVDPDAAHPLNLFRVHWYNGRGDLPEHVVLDERFTGVKARIVVALGDRFPMIRAHKVLAAYACLAPRVVAGEFDPTTQKALWPSTGNYCRGGVAISRIMGCRGVAILPEGMSAERFRWLERWVADPADIVRTPGTESNVKEIYDRTNALARDPANVVFNQFREFGNHLAHWLCTGRALGRLFESLPDARLAAFVSASGSAGTLGAGDWLKDTYGARIVAVEALECPTMLANGFGEHNIQGIGDKHIPFIHNVMNTDLVVAVSDRGTDALDGVLHTPAGRALLAARGVPDAVIGALPSFGLSSLCNVLAAIKTAKLLDLDERDVILTVATDGAAMYAAGRKTGLVPGEVIAAHLDGATTDHMLELTHEHRTRIFNLGYFTWVEQQGVAVRDFTARRDQAFWRGLRDLVPRWDAEIAEFNAR